MILVISYLVGAIAWAIFLAWVLRGRPPKANLRTVLDSFSQETAATVSSTSMGAASGSHALSYNFPTPSAPPLVPCQVCYSPSGLRCARCKVIRYCSHKCQIIHWRNGHKEECRALPTSDQQNVAGSSNQKVSEEKLGVSHKSPKCNTSGVEGGHSTADPVINEQISNNPSGETVGDDGNSSETIKLTDPDVLVCPICFESLSIPIYQCKNGHILCSLCSANVKDFCPTCNSKSEHYRCRGIEKILESAKTACPNKKYGCTINVPWVDRCAHERTCLFAPCCCPVTNCGFVGTPSQLLAHVTKEHDKLVIRFSIGRSFRAILSPDTKLRFLLEENKGTFFVIHNQRRVVGNEFSISAIGQKSMGEPFVYKLQVRRGECALSIKVSTDIIQLFQIADHAPTHYLIVPGSYFNGLDEIELKIKLYARAIHR